ncbi:MAG: hypothetical protein HQL69_21275 [Magnetococcales bacterium]|nr:hypothetical protein [Magnetococcales bacterium]
MRANYYKCRIQTDLFSCNKVVVLKYIFLLCLVLFSTAASASQWEDRRINVGYKLFPSFLAADTNIKNKKGADGKLLLIILYSDKQQVANSLAKELRETGSVRKISLNVKAVAFKDLDLYKQQKVAGLFFLQKPNSELAPIIDFANRQNAIIFSPFNGDVEKGICCGFSVTDRVVPYINSAALKAAKIKLKKFFLRVAKTHER